jgi:hypothetical protein
MGGELGWWVVQCLPKQACKQSECKQGQGLQGVQGAHARSHRGVCVRPASQGVS